MGKGQKLAFLKNSHCNGNKGVKFQNIFLLYRKQEDNVSVSKNNVSSICNCWTHGLS